MSSTTTVPATGDVDRDGATLPHRSEQLVGPRWNRIDLVVALLLALLASTVAIVWRTEIVPTDPWHYVEAARHFPTKHWVPLGYTRYGVILPVWPVARLFGNAQVTYYFWSVVSAGAIAATLYLAARRWWGPSAGLLAVAVVGTNWLVFSNLSRYYPDLMSMALVLVAMTVAIAVRGRQLNPSTRSSWTTDAGVLLIGLLLGWSFETRETAIFSWTLALPLLWVRGRLLRNVALVAAGLLAWAAVDVTISTWAYGDPLLKLHTFTRQDLATTTNPADLRVLNQFVNQPRAFYLTYIPKALTRTPGVSGGHLMLAMGVLAVLGLALRNAAVRLCSAALVVSYFLFVGIAGLFIPAHPSGRIDVVRYWIPFVPPAGLAVAGLIWVCARVISGRFTTGRVPAVALVGILGGALVVASVVPLVQESRANPAMAPNGGVPLGEVRTYLSHQRQEPVTVWTDWATARILPAYQRPAFGGTRVWEGPVRSITGKDAEPSAGDYVLLVRETAPPCSACRNALSGWRAEHHQIPGNWSPVMQTTGGGMTLYRVGA